MSEENKDIKKVHTVNEPVIAPIADYLCGVMTRHDEIDNLDWDSMPLFGPKTLDDAIDRINQAWEYRNDPSKWMTSEQMWNRLYDKFP